MSIIDDEDYSCCWPVLFRKAVQSESSDAVAEPVVRHLILSALAMARSSVPGRFKAILHELESTAFLRSFEA